MNENSIKKIRTILSKLAYLRDNDDLPMTTRLSVSDCLNLLEEVYKDKKENISASDENIHFEIKDSSTPSDKSLKKLFIVDDDEDTQRMLKFTLKKRGFDVFSEINPVKALDRIEEINPDIILLDLMMPEMTGFEFLNQIKDHSFRKKLKIIVGSARNFEKDRITVLEEGANDFISKPYNISELVLKLNNVLE